MNGLHPSVFAIHGILRCERWRMGRLFVVFYLAKDGLLQGRLLRHYLIHFNSLAVAVGNHALADVQVLRYVRGFGCLADKSEAVVDVLEGLLYFRLCVKAADGKLSLTFLHDWSLVANIVICSLDIGYVKI